MDSPRQGKNHVAELTPISRLASARLVITLLLLPLFFTLSLAEPLAESTAAISATALENRIPPPRALRSRREAAGASCSPEGQWNCMTNSFQRCASGQWSVVMDCAQGTVCSPSGTNEEFRIEHDGSVNGEGGGSGGPGGFSHGPKGSVSVTLALLSLATWFSWGLC